MDQTLRELRASNTPYVEIARHLGNVSEVACRVRAQKIGIARGRALRHRKPDLALIRNAQVRAGIEIPIGYDAREFKSDADEPAPNGNERGCQWLHGNPSARMFCGHAKRDGSPYCEHHHGRAFTGGWPLIRGLEAA
jgi:hypothetical protein